MPEITDEWAYVLSFALVILMKVICFILGYLTIRLGYKLISSGVKGEFKFSAKLGGVKTDLASVSPGLLFVLLGVLLIGYAVYVEKGVALYKGKKPEAPDVTVPGDVDSPFKGLLKDQKNADEYQGFLGNDNIFSPGCGDILQVGTRL